MDSQHEKYHVGVIENISILTKRSNLCGRRIFILVEWKYGNILEFSLFQVILRDWARDEYIDLDLGVQLY